MKITFPHMGPTLVYQKLFQLLGHETISPPRPTKRTIDLGVKHSPEFACFPYKVILGSYLEALEMGADTVVTSGGSGPCRAGFYGEVHRKTLHSLGYDPEFIIFDDFKRDPRRFMKNADRLRGANSWPRTLQAVYTAYRLAHAWDGLEKMADIRRAYEAKPGSFDRALTEILRRFEAEAETVADVNRIYREGRAGLTMIPVSGPDAGFPIRVGIVGEIFVVMEPAINMNLAGVLNRLGCEVVRSMYISEWMDHNFWPKWFYKSDGAVMEKSRPYFSMGIGGHERHNIGNIRIYREQGFDGVIHLMPFGCLPELVSQSIMPQVSRDLQIPVLTLALDEQSGLANNMTRIEAFVDLLKNRRGTRTA
jgi:predicted nucleotide-binding protein (sugar kinase/HSP70/actin superfamily)